MNGLLWFAGGVVVGYYLLPKLTHKVG